MEQITKTFLGIYLILLLTFTGVSIISATIDASHAEQYAADMASVIEASNFSATMIEKLEQNAQQNNYDVTITKIDSNGDGLYDMAEIDLRYKYSLPFLNASEEAIHHARAFAR